MRRSKAVIAIVLIVPAIVACGGSRTSTTATSGAPSTDQGAPRALTSSGANDTTPLDSRAYRKLVATAAAQRGLSPPIAARVADCIVRQETAQGYRTVAQVAESATTRRQAVQDAAECTARALPGP